MVIAALSRHYNLSAPLVLVLAGLAIGWIPGLSAAELDPEFVLFVILPPLLYSAAQDSSYQEIRANRRAIGMLAIGLPLATAVVVGLVAYASVPHLPLAAALVLGAIVAPPDAVSAQAIGRRVGLPRRIMTLLGGESLLNDATALTALRVALAAAVGATTSVWDGIETFLLAAIGGVVIGLLIGLQLPDLIRGLAGQSWLHIAFDAAMVLIATILVRFAWVYLFTYASRLLPGVRRREPPPKPSWLFVVGWSGMRGVVSLAAAFSIPLTTESGEPFPARAEILFLTFVVVVGTLLIQGVSLPWVIRRLGVYDDDAASDRLAYAAAQDRASREAEAYLDTMAADIGEHDPRHLQVAMLRKWITTQRNTAWEELGRGPEDIGESPTAAGNRMRSKMLAIQRRVFIDERDAGHIDDEVLRTALRRLDFAEGVNDREA